MSIGVLDGLPGVPDELARALAEPLIDHHVHGCFTGDVDRAAFEESLNEASPDPIPPFMTQFDSQLGFAVRRWCAPRLGLDPHAGADEYWARRAELGSVGTARALLPAAGVSEWLVDTGFAADRLCPPDQLATWSGGSAAVVLRLESLAESLLADGVPAGGFADAFRDRLAARLPDVVGAKTIAAYRCGFAIDWARPSDAAVARAVDAWAGAGSPRLTSAELVAFGVHAAADAGLPIQVHVGPGRPRPGSAAGRPAAARAVVGAAAHRPGAGAVVALLPVPPRGRLPGPGLRPRVHGRRARGQSSGRAVGRAARRVVGAGTVRQAAVLVGRLRTAGAAPARRGAVAARDGAGARAVGCAEGDWSLPTRSRVVRMIGAGNAARVYGRL